MRILLVEDQDQFAGLLAYSLEDFAITHVKTLAAAKTHLNDSRTDLVLLDLGLPDSQGLDTLRALKDYKVPKIVITARPGMGEEMPPKDCYDYVSKTASIHEIVARVRFNIGKLQAQVRKPFAPHVFAQIRECLDSTRTLPPFELTRA